MQATAFQILTWRLVLGFRERQCRYMYAPIWFSCSYSRRELALVHCQDAVSGIDCIKLISYSSFYVSGVLRSVLFQCVRRVMRWRISRDLSASTRAKLARYLACFGRLKILIGYEEFDDLNSVCNFAVHLWKGKSKTVDREMSATQRCLCEETYLAML